MAEGFNIAHDYGYGEINIEEKIMEEVLKRLENIEKQLEELEQKYDERHRKLYEMIYELWFQIR